MNHFDAIAAALPAHGLDGILLTGAPNRFYATGFASDSEGGVALVTTKGNFFFTDSRYIEAAEAAIDNAAIGLVDALPIFGVGTILWPWILLSVVRGQWSWAVGLAVIYGVSNLARQWLEARYMGDRIGYL